MNQFASRHQVELETQGWTLVPDIVPPALVDELNAALVPSLARRDAIRIRNGLMDNCNGTAHHVLADAPCYVDLLANFEKLDSLLIEFFGGKYILNSYGGFINDTDLSTYAHHTHRDIRFHSTAKRFMLNTLVMLDDFTVENGATLILSGSQNQPEKPADDTFRAHADPITGRCGAVLLFDSRIWHAAGTNRTAFPRRALTLTFTCPFFKQQLDYPRLFGYANAADCSDYLRQVIGFNARTPASLDEYYRPVEQRFYQRGQD
ncbi:phytanoyl-CoA dioxygenase family protein [Burkholderia cenocepacia]|uniref:phytanoyl-CoA dioxygenase family protein n=1 Tax=Burkholderia cenocepacia TaxID=95486 RepID=UPI002B2479B5|nr:phytanoyl-CoA dioxygenase family protein [Burkholderia cenocepacia]MEB2604807.1 phytanoyl-CoA dioxygenase family protein [Burkholderia cenocepacia]